MASRESSKGSSESAEGDQLRTRDAGVQITEGPPGGAGERVGGAGERVGDTGERASVTDVGEQTKEEGKEVVSQEGGVGTSSDEFSSYEVTDETHREVEPAFAASILMGMSNRYQTAPPQEEEKEAKIESRGSVTSLAVAESGSSPDENLSPHRERIPLSRMNVPDIQPQFKGLTLDSPTEGEQEAAVIPQFTKSYRAVVNIHCGINSDLEYEIIGMSCDNINEFGQPEIEMPPTRESGSSGHFGDQSKPVSSYSGSPGTTYILPPTSHLQRVSAVTTSSEGSAMASAAALARANQVTANRISQLSKKWKNHQELFNILDYLDRVFDDSIPPEMEEAMSDKRMDKRKRPTTTETDVSVKKKKPIAGPPIAAVVTQAEVGLGVFARWQNGKYFFAALMDFTGNGNVQVRFLDHTFANIPTKYVVPDIDKLIGQTVSVVTDLENFGSIPGIVNDVVCQDGVLKYIVLTNSGDFQVSVGQVFFDEAQAALMQNNDDTFAIARQPLSSITAQFSEVVTSIAASRSTDVINVDDEEPGTSGLQRSESELRATSESDTCSTQSSSVDLTMGVVPGCQMETHEPQNLDSTIKLKSVQGKPPKNAKKEEDNIVGPIDVQGLWFKGLSFLLTCSSDSKRDKNGKSAQSSDTNTDSEDYPFSKVPFLYNRLTLQIQLGGGEVFDKFEQLPRNKYGQTFLISDRPHVTPKCVKCIAAGISVLSHEWIIHCTQRQKRLPLNELPIGWSVEKKRFISNFERKNPLPLRGTQIQMAYFNDKAFARFWPDVCRMLGAGVITFTEDFESADIIVAQHRLRIPKLDEAIACGIPVVSVQWVIQCMILGEVRPVDGHPSYSHTFDEKDQDST